MATLISWFFRQSKSGAVSRGVRALSLGRAAQRCHRGFSPAPAGLSPAGPHPLIWGPGPKSVWLRTNPNGSATATLQSARENRLGWHGRGIPRRERRPGGVQEDGRDQARLAPPVREEAVHWHVLGRGARQRAALALQLRAGLRYRRGRQHLLHRHGVRGWRRFEGRDRAPPQDGGAVSGRGSVSDLCAHLRGALVRTRTHRQLW